MKFPLPCTDCFSSSPKKAIERSMQDGQNPENFRIFSCKELKSATNGFHSSNKLGEGGFGSVYKVFLSPATSNSAYIETSYIYDLCVCLYTYKQTAV
ncbi:hypothetical protein C1H46_044949 [Malus baccata]|uniref:Protein kinase domain-containing protein n=1 Tax=Malus baccata TaxID=106549 RepID=A0A540K5L0_MALBA|nr:hypothetical protein C1H46_044949 [Malus baccata]